MLDWWRWRLDRETYLDKGRLRSRALDVAVNLSDSHCGVVGVVVVVDEGYVRRVDGDEYCSLEFKRYWMKQKKREQRRVAKTKRDACRRALSVSDSSIGARPFLDFVQGWLRLGGRHACDSGHA